MNKKTLNYVKATKTHVRLIFFSPLMPCIPHFAPATLHPNVMASQSFVPLVRAKIVAALNVSPAAKVSQSFSGGKQREVTSWPSQSMAAAPSSPQAQMTEALVENNNASV